MLIFVQGLKQGPNRRGNVVATRSLNFAEFAYAQQEKTAISIPFSVPNGIECSPILSVSNPTKWISLLYYIMLAGGSKIGKADQNTIG